jgi:hypothetical protein
MSLKEGLAYDSSAIFLHVIRDMNKDSKIYTQQMDSIIEHHIKTNPPKQLVVKPDLKSITKEFLIENIDYAFLVWKEKPWCQHLSFEEFCEWILPYRVYNEPLQPWRKFMYKQLSWLEDSVTDPCNVIEVTKRLNKFMSLKYKYTSKLNMPFLGGIDAWKNAAGGCEHGYALMTMACRSIGLPVAIDFTYQYPNWPGDHSWMVLLDKDKELVPFNGISDRAKFEKIERNPIPKHVVTTIFRNTFAKNVNENNQTYQQVYPKNIADPFIKSVTHEYKDQTKGDFQINTNIKSAPIAFLYSFKKGLNSTAVAHSFGRSGLFDFKNIGYSGYYYVRFLEDSLSYHRQPFYWNGDSITFLKPDYDNPISLKLFRKYSLKSKEINFHKETLHGQIQASNDKNFRSFVTLHVVDTITKEYPEVKLKHNNKYQYYRYLNDSNSIHLAEINYYKKYKDYTSRIDGVPYGFAEDRPKADNEAAFDGRIETNCNTGKGSWVAINTGEPIHIESVQLIARNHLNIIEPGNVYELFYFDQGWRSAGVQMTHHYYIKFDSIPANTLYVLHNHTKGKEERIFTYEYGKQTFH